MTQNTNQVEQENRENIAERLRSQQASHPALSEEENKRLAILNIKADPAFRNELKEGKEGKDKKAQDEFLETIKKGFGDELGATFKDLKITEEEEKERNELLAKTKEEKDREIKKINHELINSVPEDLFEGFDDEKTKREKEERGEYTFPVSLEEMRITLRTRLPEKMRVLFEQFFMLKLDLSNWTGNREQDRILAQATGGAVVEKHFDQKSGKDKFRVTFDPECCINHRIEETESGDVDFSYFSYDKLAYLVTRSILATIKGENKKEFDEWCKENGFGEKVDKNVKEGSDDWLAMVLSDYEKCSSDKRIDPNIVEKAGKWLEDIKPEDVLNPSELQEPIVISRLDIEKRIKENKMERPYKDRDTGKHVEPGILLTLLEKTGILGKAMYSLWQTVSNIKIIDRQYINILLAEEDAKEAKKIESRMLSGSEYIPMLKEPQYCNNQSKMRALILTIANKGYWQWWMMQFYLWKFDWKFQMTHGKEIHADSYDFMSRVCKAHQKAVKGPAIAIPEYKIVGNKFIRSSHKDQMNVIDDVLKGLPTRTVQNIASDALEMIMVKGKFIDLDAKLSTEEYKDEKNPHKHFCATDGKYLENFMSNSDAKNFAGDMQKYADTLGEQEFNNLVGAGIKSVVRRLKRATRVEKEIFSLYTSPILREAYDAYQDKVGEAGYVEKEYKNDFEEKKKELKDAKNDVFGAIDNYSFEELSDIYNQYVKEDSTSPLMRGTEMTARGRLNIFFQQARGKIVNMPKSEIPEHVQDFVISQIDLLHKKSEITDRDIEQFKKKMATNENLAKLDDEAREKLLINVNQLLGHMENLGFAKQYSLLFKPFDDKLFGYLPRGKGDKGGKGMEPEEQNKAKKFLWEKIAPVSDLTNVRDKLKAITFKYPEITFTSKEMEKIKKFAPHQQNIEIFSMLSEKLVECGKPDISKLALDYEKLNQLYWQVSQYVKYSDSSYNLGELAQDFRSLNLIPDSYKKKPINSIETLQKYIKLAKVVVNNYYAEEDKRKQKKKTMGIAAEEGLHSQDMEEEMVAMEEEETAAAEEG